MKLTIVTACSRPENLPRLAASLAGAPAGVSLSWLVEFDDGSAPDSRVGNAQKNAALERISGGWVYFLDDDNLLHPELLPALAALDLEGYDLVLFHQELENGWRHAGTTAVRPNYIDLAQFVARRELVGPRRFDLPAYNSDGLLIEELYRGQRARTLFLDRALAYYNRLRWNR